MKKAFGLIELVMSIGLFAVLAIAVSTMVISTLRGARKTAAINVAKAEGQYALNDMTQVIKFAKSASCPAGGTSVIATKSDGTTVTYQLSGGLIQKVVVPVLNLTSAASKVTSCSGTVFTCTATTVTICYYIDSAGASDVTNSVLTGTQGIQFQSQLDLRNAGN